MSSLKKEWIERLFKHFDKIYGAQAIEIDKTIGRWQLALIDVTFEQIKYALEVCKEDTSIIPTPHIFKSLCDHYLCTSGNMNDDCSQNKDNTEYYLSSTIPPPAKILKGKDRIEWLMSLTEMQALGLNSSDGYDRTRLLIEQEGYSQVEKFAHMQQIDEQNRKLNNTDSRAYKDKRGK